MSVPATLRGYRTQYLYTLYRILGNSDSENIFIPEGLEDLDIVHTDGGVEYIQVKNLSSTLTFSDLFSKAKTTSFFQRLLNARNEGNIKGVIVSFGSISPELADNKILKKSIKAKFGSSIKYDSIKWLVDNISCETVKEDLLYDKCTEFISSSFPAMSPAVCIQYLLQWIYECAEKQSRITYSMLVEQMNLVGKFIQGKHTFETTFGKDIIPCSSINKPTDIRNLTVDFFNGASARYEDILAQLDVERKEKLEKLSELFTKFKIVVLHGASGQGKSTLSYQFINRVIGSSFSYLLPNLNRGNLNDVISSLNAFSSNLKLPILVYVDGKTVDDSWIQLINSLNNKENIRVLVTVREDEWNLYKNLLQQSANIGELQLNFSFEEAKVFYERFKVSEECKYKSFEESWYNFRGGSSLLEYVYLLTHGKSLESRIKSQIDVLRLQHDFESIKLLKYISLADIYAGGSYLSELKKMRLIDNDLLVMYLSNLNNEFFKYDTNDGFIKGLHQLRSKFILQEITMGNKQSIIEAGLRLYPCINYYRRKGFLLSLISDGMTRDVISSYIENYDLSDPTLYLPLLDTFLWIGIRDYKERNNDVINEFVKKYKTLWTAMAGLNFTEIDIDKPLLQLFDKQILNDANNLRLSLTPKENIFVYAKDFLRQYPQEFKNRNAYSVEAIGKILFYQSLMHEKSCSFVSSIDFENCTLNQLSTLLLGLKSTNEPSYTQIINKVESIFVYKLRQEYNIISFVQTKEEIFPTSFINYMSESKLKDKSNLIEQHNIDIIELCRRAFPEKLKFTSDLCKDLLLNQLGISLPLSKSVSRENLPLKELVDIVSTLGGIVRYEQNKVYNLNDYFDKVEKRKNIYKKNIEDLTELFIKYIKTRSNWSLKEIDRHRKNDLYFLNILSIDIPRTNLTEWGINSKFGSQGDDEGFEESIKIYNELINNYFSSLNNFFNQYYNSMIDIIKGTIDHHNVQVATYNLQDAIQYFYKIRSYTIEQYNDYIDWNSNDEKSIVCLWLAWSSITRKEFSNKYSIELLYNYYKRDLEKIGNDVAASVSSELLCNGFKNKAIYEDHSLKIRAIYRSFPDFLNCGILIIQILRQKLQKQIQFSTVKLVETVLFKNIEYYPILSNGIEYKSLDGQYLSYSWISIENQQDVFPQPRILVSTEPKWIDINEGVALIKKCAEAVAQIGLVKSIFDNP